MMEETLKRKIIWQSRRGLLELDILLARFIKSPTFHELDKHELIEFLEILKWEDHDFLNAINKINSIDDANKKKILNKLILSAKNRNDNTCLSN